MNRALPLSATAATVALSAALASFGTAAMAQNVTCGQDYTVRSGDSLSKIAAAAYDDASAYQLIYSANADVIGPNPGQISIGMKFFIPCLGDTTASTAAPISEELGVERLPFPNERQIRIVQGSQWAPYADETQEQGGMLTEIANVAMTNAPGSPDYKIDFINDWGAHLSPLVTDHAYDLGLSWFRPNCEFTDRLGEDSQFRCNNFDWTDALFEQLLGYYSADGVAYSDYSQLMGKTVCRPAGYSTFMLEENNLVEPNVTMFRPVDPAECFTGIAAGDVDVAVVATDIADGLMLEAGLTDQIMVNEPLGQVLTLNAVISKNHPQGEEILAAFNGGLSAIKESGAWFEIVRRHLSEFRAKTQG